MLVILAIGLGNFNSMRCFLDTTTIAAVSR